jgi:hypothetical protein
MHLVLRSVSEHPALWLSTTVVALVGGFLIRRWARKAHAQYLYDKTWSYDLDPHRDTRRF